MSLTMEKSVSSAAGGAGDARRSAATLDELPRLDLRQLVQMGIFDAPGSSLKLSFRGPDGALNVALTALQDGEDRSLLITEPTPEAPSIQSKSHRIAVGKYTGRRAYWLRCPVSHQRCQVIYFADGQWMARWATGLAYSSRCRPSSERDRDTLLDLASRLAAGGVPAGHRKTLAGRIEVIARRLEQRSRRNERRPVTSFEDLRRLSLSAGDRDADTLALARGRMGTEQALARATSFGATNPHVGGHRIIGAPWEPSTTDSCHGIDPGGLDLDFLVKHPHINMVSLLNMGAICRDGISSASLDWSFTGSDLTRSTITCDFTDAQNPICEIKTFSGTISSFAIRLLRDPRSGGILFLCPFSGRAVETLAFRSGVIGSAAALRLTRRVGRGRGNGVVLSGGKRPRPARTRTGKIITSSAALPADAPSAEIALSRRPDRGAG